MISLYLHVVCMFSVPSCTRDIHTTTVSAISKVVILLHKRLYYLPYSHSHR